MVVLTNKTVRIRKSQRCWGCNFRYPIGTELQYCTGVDGGRFWSAYYCPVCQALYNEYDPYDDGISQGGIFNECRQTWLNMLNEQADKVANHS